MPHKHNADRRHHIPKMSFKARFFFGYFGVTNGRAEEVGR
jgi:hypothetical protein